ncbi:NAD(P)-dependent dehydrogenase (short-subunit alcohol dehydrogenase family) [Ureibacillus xyleni]|uniref:NAD(P)-dependent dehydrogenase (Short-subunit alcohol dehydrogenase family) n=1 Tax=Ureibacillus xyleni TaxID=614648 RepID=A0A285STQ5_9BACL|nr:SDR family NAD(P)-dependent oxidoreductase [Ureibacillus xyleni]SOC11544.1 NAD(P)-dependent dehydrogenase (short-subunit alcohol dehydrogenase family) [Ureibacillus xyleni]
MEEKIIIITGANSGIGKAAALKFATEGYRVIMACRNLKISLAAQQEIIHLSDNKLVDLMELDVSSFASIHSFCATFKSKYPHLDILINNAAYLNHGEKEYKLSPENIELSFATNTFGPFLLSSLLKNHLEKSKDPRILNACTTNIKHFFDPKRRIEFDNLQGELKDTRTYNVYKMYGDSKMALLILTFKMAEEYKDAGIKVNALQINRVKLSKETIEKMHSKWKVLARIQNLINPAPSRMADNYFDICTSEAYKNVTGQLFNHKREIIKPATSEKGIAQIKNIFGISYYPKYANDPKNVEQVWKLCTKLTFITN